MLANIYLTPDHQHLIRELVELTRIQKGSWYLSPHLKLAGLSVQSNSNGWNEEHRGQPIAKDWHWHLSCNNNGSHFLRWPEIDFYVYHTYGLRCQISKTKLHIKALSSYRKYSGLVGGLWEEGTEFRHSWHNTFYCLSDAWEVPELLWFKGILQICFHAPFFQFKVKSLCFTLLTQGLLIFFLMQSHSTIAYLRNYET